jgi:hypothetical protein
MRRSDERSLAALEAEYATSLKAALKQCAEGRWGLLGHNDAVHERQFGKHYRPRLVPPEVDELIELGSQIERLRKQLGYSEPFHLHEHLLKLRSSTHPNSRGEPALARQWLEEMGS